MLLAGPRVLRTLSPHHPFPWANTELERVLGLIHRHLTHPTSLGHSVNWGGGLSSAQRECPIGARVFLLSLPMVGSGRGCGGQFWSTRPETRFLRKPLLVLKRELWEAMLFASLLLEMNKETLCPDYCLQTCYIHEHLQAAT